MKLGLAWKLSRDEFLDLTSRACFYCGERRTRIRAPKHSKTTGAYEYVGVDRVDSSLGYVPGNVVPCCAECNSKKREMTLQDFERFSRALKRFYIARYDSL